MADDESTAARKDRGPIPTGVEARRAANKPDKFEDFERKHKHLSHEQALQIIEEANGDRRKADEVAERKRRVSEE